MPSQTRSITLVWEDAEGNTHPETLYFDSADLTDLATAQAAVTDYATLMAAISGCIITDAHITWQLSVPTPGTADGGYFVTTGAYFSFKDSNEVAQGFYIPGVTNENMIGKIVNSEATGVEALIEAAIGNGVDVEPLSTRGSGAQFSEFRTGKQANRKT